MTDLIETNSAVLGVTDPEQALAAAERFAAALKARIDAGGLARRISGKEYLGIEALTLAATALGIVGVGVETRELKDGGYWARAEARVISTGQVVGAGESVCTAGEPRWAHKSPFERLGMAQTRALNRALRGPVGSVISLAAYSITPAEEVAETAEPAPAELPSWAKPVDDVKKVAQTLLAILRAMDSPAPEQSAAQIGQTMFDRCDGTIPACVLTVLEEVVVESIFREEKPS